MNICFVANCFGLGGLEKVNAFVGNELNKAPATNIFFYSILNQKPFYELEGAVEYFPGYSLVSKVFRRFMKVEMLLKKGSYTPSIYDKELLHHLIQFTKRNEIKVVVLNNLLAGYLPYLKRKLPQVKFIAWMHGNPYQLLSPNLTSGVKNQTLDSFKKGLHLADQIVCLVEEDKKGFAKLNPLVRALNNPLTLSVSGRCDLNATNLAFLGRMDWQEKGLDYLVEIVQKLPAPWTLSVGGAGADEEKFLNALKEKGIRHKVNYVGQLDDQGIKDFFEQASMYLMTSRYEGFGLVLTEAMSFGLPILAFEQTGANAILESGKHGILIKNGDVDAMMIEINKLISDKQLRRYYQEKSLKRVQDFKIETIASQWMCLFEELLKEEGN